MGISIELDPRPFVKLATGLHGQLPFVAARALNDVATAFQQDERAGINTRMTIRRPWVLQGVKIERQDFARKDKLEARVHIDGDRDFLVKFETGATKTARGNSLAIPLTGSPAKPTQATVIPTRFRPKSLNLREVSGAAMATAAKRLSSRSLKGGVLRGAFRVFEGDRGTILIQNRTGGGVLLQRVGRGKRAGLRVLYVLQRRAKQRASLRFGETARETWKRRWPETVRRRWEEAVRTAR